MILFTYGDPLGIYNINNDLFFSFTHKSWLNNSSQEIVNSFPKLNYLSCKLFLSEEDAFFYAYSQIPVEAFPAYNAKINPIYQVEYVGDNQSWISQEITIQRGKFKKERKISYLEVARDEVELIYGALKIFNGKEGDFISKRTLLEHHYQGWGLNCVLS